MTHITQSVCKWARYNVKTAKYSKVESAFMKKVWPQWAIHLQSVLVKKFVFKNTSKSLQKARLNPLNAKLNPFCPLLALFGAHHTLHISGKGFNGV